MSRKALVLNPSETTTLKFSVYKGGVVNDPNLVGYWSFDEGSGNVANDLSGNGNTGSLSAGTTYTIGKVGSALKFDAPGEKVTMSNSINFINSFTFSHWIKTTQTNAQTYTIGNAGGGDGYRFGIWAGKIAFLIGDNTGYYEKPCGANQVNDGNWHLITGIFDRDLPSLEFRCYIDDKYIATVSLPSAYLLMQTSPPSFAAPPCCTDFVGEMDEVQIYNRALSAEEIKNIAQGNLIAVNKGCIADTTPTQTQPFQIISQVSKNVANGESANSQILIKAYNSPVDTVCQICATPLGGGGCSDVRVIIK